VIEIIESPFEPPRYWRISGYHQKLKDYACRLLQERYEFNVCEISQEYTFWIPFAGHPKDHRYQIDVVGFRNGKPSVAVECGMTPICKLTELEKFFELVIWLQS